MFRMTTVALLTKTSVRIALAVALLLIGLAPIGAPILSGNSWREAPADTGAAASIAQPFTYRWTNDTESARIERSDDSGQTWYGVASLPERVEQMQTVAGDEQSVVARTARTIWVSRDAGATWAQAAALPSKPLALAVTGKDTNLLAVGTESAGLVFSRDLGATWQQSTDPVLLGGGGAPVAVTALSVNPADDTILYAATGIWLGTSTTRLTTPARHLRRTAGSAEVMEQLPAEAAPSPSRRWPINQPPRSCRIGDSASTTTPYRWGRRQAAGNLPKTSAACAATAGCWVWWAADYLALRPCWPATDTDMQPATGRRGPGRTGSRRARPVGTAGCG